MREAEVDELVRIDDPTLFLAKTQEQIQKHRVSIQIRQSHLQKRGKRDENTDAILEEMIKVEAIVDELVEINTESHPAFRWFTSIRGVGAKNIGKVVGFIKIERAPTPSSLWKYCGYHTTEDPENPGKRIAPRRIKGVKLDYNNHLRSMCWLLGDSLIKGGGKFYDYYVQEKAKYTSRFIGKGYKILPAASITKKDKQDGNVISQGHIHEMAKRKMIKLFLSCLWHVWREAEGLPTRVPYAIEHLPEHTHLISPWDMVDREPRQPKRRRIKKIA